MPNDDQSLIKRIKKNFAEDITICFANKTILNHKEGFAFAFISSSLPALLNALVTFSPFYPS